MCCLSLFSIWWMRFSFVQIMAWWDSLGKMRFSVLWKWRTAPLHSLRIVFPYLAARTLAGRWELPSSDGSTIRYVISWFTFSMGTRVQAGNPTTHPRKRRVKILSRPISTNSWLWSGYVSRSGLQTNECSWGHFNVTPKVAVRQTGNNYNYSIQKIRMSSAFRVVFL